VRLGFANVIDAFHVSRGGEPTQTRFFVDERASRQGITLTDHLLELANGQRAKVLPREVDARWNQVQLSWGLGLGTRLVSLEMAPDKEAVDLYAPARLRRGPITGVRGRPEHLSGRPLRLLPHRVHRHRDQPGGRRSCPPVRSP
jgi:hypothetical protein